MPSLFEADGRINANLQVPVIFHKNYVDLKEAYRQGIKYEICGDSIILHLKGLMDSGSSDHLIGEDIGKIVHKGGRFSTVHSILDDRKAHAAREVDGFFISGLATFLFVKEVVKPQNNILLMNIVANQMKIPENQKRKFNLASY